MVKVYPSPGGAVAGIPDGASIMVGGFGGSGVPEALLAALAETGAKRLTFINNNAGLMEGGGIETLVRNRQVQKVICTFPGQRKQGAVEEQFLRGEVDIETLPQGTFIERIRAGGAGIGGFYTTVAVGTPLAEGKERRIIDGREYVLELPLHADFALVRAHRADRFGNLAYRYAACNFNPTMAAAADVTIAEVAELVEPGEIPPDQVRTPGIYVDRLVVVGYSWDVH
ncbi:MAG: 3-oxoacid CoA-transferase subunit A [Candidatus Rokubacteria bacterium]|nr:3-oxoacid CoA-transferase subunit A [Candidatus Rokubacteria bacterium]